MKILKNSFKYIVSLLCCLTCALNTVLIKPYSAKIDDANIKATVAQTATNVVPETVYKVKMYDSSLIEEDEKHDAVMSSISTATTSSDLTDEEMIEFEILTMIYSNIAYDLYLQGFDVFESTAIDLLNNVSYFGLTYTDNNIVQDNYVSGGFVNIVNDNSILSDSIDLVAFNNGENDGYKYIITDYEQEKNDDHFVFYNKYIKYNWVNDKTVKYEILENNKAYYDTNMGSIYSYDESEYVYDNDFTYTKQEVSMMFSEIDFDELQKTLDEINAEQNKNGYYVQEVTITYIDMELIEEWERCSDKDSFYGYNLEDLNNAFDPETTLEFTQDGVKQAALIEDPKPTNWLKAGLMFLGGCAAILIGAALAPLTGGCTFGAALLCIVKMTAVAMATDLLLKTTISTISGVVQGQNFWDALDGAVRSTFTVENIAQSFMTSAIMSAVMVGSGLVKACFVEGTPVLTTEGYKNIETLAVGDKVLSYNELTGVVAAQVVTETMVNTSDDICTIALSSGETITSTALHPWYVEGKGWVPAYALTTSDELLTESGEDVKILGVNRQKLDEPISVYNIAVNDVEDEAYHTYFVGSDNILVHNACTTKTSKTDTTNPSKSQIKSQRQKAVRNAWKKEQNAVANGTSKYNWTSAQKEQILKYGKVKGYDGCHLQDVSQCIKNGRLDLIGDPDNIVFLKRFGENSHFFVHGNNWKNATDLVKVKEILPWIAEQLSKLGL